MKIQDIESRKAETARSGISKVAGKFRGMLVPEDNLRPQRLSEFIGQPETVAELGVMLEAAKMDKRQPEHVLMTGPGGLGKTTVALLMANELGVPLVATTAPTLGQEPLVRLLSGIEPGTLIFVDEIHRMSKRTEELLYAAMEDGFVDANTPAGPVRRKIEPFTLVGATTLPGRLSESFKDRFGYVARLHHYSVDELTRIVKRSAAVLGKDIDDTAAQMVAERSRGVARVANSYLRRVSDFARVRGHETITADTSKAAFDLYGVDELGLDRLARRVLRTVRDRFSMGPVGVENLALAVGGEDNDTIHNDVEPYLVKLGLLMRSPKGRVLTELGAEHLRDVEGME